MLFDGKSVGFKYEIVYEIDGVAYERKNRVARRGGVKIAGGDMVYPTSVIACYSGEDTRLWKEAYEPYYMQYFKKAVRDVTYYPKTMYINKYSWKTAFISLLCSPKETVKQFLRDNLGLADISTVTVRFVADTAKRETFQNHFACRWYDNLMALQDQSAQHEINANEIASTDMMRFGARANEDPERVFQFLYLLSMPERNDEGQTIDKLITDIKIKIGDVDFDNLSEGEKKMILIECITQILADDNSLVLLDEPDAHVHIDNKRKILEAVEHFNGQTILTTHSPVMCNMVKEPINILLLMNGTPIYTSRLDKLKELSGNELKYYEGAFVLSSKNMLVTEGIYDIRYLRKAIDVFSKTNPKYKKLREIGMLYAGSASEAHIIYDELLSGMMDKIEHVVFLFDYDKAGLDEWKRINTLATTKPKIEPLFYQIDYSVTLNTAIDTVDAQDTILVEDMFDNTAYASLFVGVPAMSATHKYFRCRQKITERIKKHIQENYASYEDRYFAPYQALLDKLLNIYFNE